MNVSIAQSENEKCNKGDETGGCCKTKLHFFKVKDKHVLADYMFNAAKHFSELDLPQPLYKGIIINKLQFSIANRSHAPPIQTGVPTYLLNCAFLI